MSLQQQTRKLHEIDSAVIRFAGDSGDGMQLVGDQFTSTSALMEDDVATLPDYPSEIRAPAGTIAGVSGFQVCFGTSDVFTPGDKVDFLVAMNPAALKVNMPLLREGATLILNEDAFQPRNLEKAGYSANPLESGELSKYQVLRVGMGSQTQKALEGSSLSPKQVERCKNFFALGFLYKLFGRNQEHTLKWIRKKFEAKKDVLEANLKAMQAGWAYAEGDAVPVGYSIRKKSDKRGPGVYRHVSGNTASALGLLAGARRAGLKLFLGSYPITPATDIMMTLQKYPSLCNVFQAEDEIAGIGSALGAAFGGALAATSTSGPGFSLKSEFINLAVMVELPLIVVNVQRGGPSTGLPTKTEQSDLLQALWGRHGESPIVVLAAASPRDCFDIMIEAARIATEHMTPVIVLTDGYLGNGSEVWRVPNLEDLPKIKPPLRTNPEGYLPYDRNPETLARPWVVPGTPKMEHRIGGLEKEDKTGVVSHSPANHEKMVQLRAEKVARVAKEIPPMQVYGDPNAQVLVLGWGSTRGVIQQAVKRMVKQGVPVASAHLRHLNPLPSDLKALLKKYPKILVPEINTGQLWFRLRGEYLLDLERLNKVQGQPFRSEEIEAKVKSMLGVQK